MKKLIITFCTLLIVLSTESCNRAEEKVIHINPNSQDQHRLDEFVKHTEIIPLETCDEALIKNITKVVLYKNKYFIKDIYEGLFVFDKNGLFKHRIGKKGRGPGEYGYIADFCVNRYNSNIEVLTPRGSIMIYNVEGEYLETIKYNSIEVSNFLIVDEDLILFFHQSQSPIMTLFSRKDQSVIKEFFNVPTNFERRRPYHLISPPFYVTKNDTMIQYGYLNDVYAYKHKDIIHRYSFNFGKHNFVINDYDWSLEFDKDYYREMLWKNKDIVFGFNNHYETDRYILKQYYYDRGSWMFLYDKKMKKDFVIPIFIDLYKLSLDRYQWETISPASETGTRLMSILNWDSGSDYILTSVDAAKKDVYINSFSLDSINMRKYNMLEISDNPILVKYYLKD